MKTTNTIIATLAICLLAGGSAYSETVHQTTRGEDAFAGEGAKAIDKKIIEVKEISDSGKVARVVDSVPQWGYVNYWFGLPAPAGASILRVKLYVDENETANYAFYIKKADGELIEKLQIPADAKPNSFVSIDIPVDLPQEWNGVALKKTDNSDKPGPWIDSISVVVP